MWYKWNSIEDFNAWHSDIQYRLYLPNDYTEDYTKPVVVSATDVRGFVLTKDIRLSDLLGSESDNPYPPTIMN